MEIINTPRAFAVIILASAGQEVASFLIHLPEQLLVEAQNRIVNLAIQYGSIAIGQAAVGSKVINPTAPAKLFLEGVESLATASTPEEAVSRGSVAAGVLILSSLSSQNPNASLTFGAFLLVLVQNVLRPGSQFLFSKSLFYIYLIKNILIRIITEIQVERKRKKLGLPWAKLKFYIFRKQKDKIFISQHFLINTL